MRITGFAAKIDMLNDLQENTIENYIDDICHYTRIHVLSYAKKKNPNATSFGRQCDIVQLPGQVCTGIFAALAEAISHHEDMTIQYAKASDGHDYLIFPMQFPWNMKCHDRTASENIVMKMLSKHASKLLGQQVELTCNIMTLTI